MLSIYVARMPHNSRVLLDGVELSGVRGVTVRSHVGAAVSEITLHMLTEAEIELESGNVVFIEREVDVAGGPHRPSY